MSAPADAMTARRIVIICFGLEAARLHKQPWHSAWGMALGLRSHGFAVHVITDAKQPPAANAISMRSIEKLFERNAPSSSLRRELKQLAPERAIVVIGSQELLHPHRFALGVPVSLLIANQRFRAHELLRLTFIEWWREWSLLRMLLLQSSLPPILLRRGLRSAKAAHLVFLSAAAQKRHAEAGLPPGSVVKPRVAAEFLAGNNAASHVASRPKTLCHFGPPLFLRGVKHVIAAFIAACESGSDARLVLLLRVDDEYTAQRTAELKALIDRSAGRHRERIQLIDARLSAVELAQKLGAADIFVLPFNVTVSDVPLVIIEAAMSGKPVITFDTPGVSEWREAFPNIVITSARQLSAVMQQLIAQDITLPVADCSPWSDWQLALAPLANALCTPLDCASLLPYRMICLMGIDGSGKSTLLARLSEQMGLQGYAHGYIWSRFRNYFSKPFLALMRLTGHNRKVVIDGVRMGVHDFVGHPLLSRLFLFLQRCDLWLDIQLRYKPRLRRERILGDRCPLDTLVDLAIDTGMDDAIFAAYGRRVFATLPQPSLMVVVARDAQISQRDRPDIAADPNYQRRAALYTRLAATFDLPVLHNDGTLEDSLKKLLTMAENSVHARSVARI